MKKLVRGPMIYILIFFAIGILAYSLNSFNAEDKKDFTYPQFLEAVEAKQVKTVYISVNNLYGIMKDSTISEKDLPGKYDFKTYLPSITIFNEDMRAITGKQNTTDFGITIRYSPAPEPSILITLLPYLVLILLIGGLAYYMLRQSQGGGKAMSFGKSKARMTISDSKSKTFEDVAGADEEKEELKEIVEFLKDPKRFTTLGARIPKGVLLVGPPGGGKTLLAKAVAGEARVPFFSISGSDFVEMFVGVGASRVRDLFDNAKKNAPSIVFIDEIDAVGRHRGAGMGGGHDEREQTLNQLLVEMDGFETNTGVIVMAATNRKDILDPALLRPGRFDRQIVVNFPDVKGREEILKVHAKGKPLSGEVNLKELAKMTVGFIGADLENILNEAAILTARAGKNEIGKVQLEEAVTRVLLGPEKHSRVITEKDKKCTAYHEVGHAICAKALPGCDPVHEISIIPRGMAAGYTMTLPETDDNHEFRSQMIDHITMMLGGRVAEKIILNDISAGASNDIKRSSELARKMVINFGMSEDIGPIFLGGEEEVFLGRDYGHSKMYSEEMAGKIDTEVKKIIDEAYQKAQDILNENLDKLIGISETLITREKLDEKEFDLLFNGKELPKQEDEAEKLNIGQPEAEKDEQAQDLGEGENSVDE